MDTPERKKSSAGKVELFRSFFSGLESVFGTYDPNTGRSWQVKKPVTSNTILDHLQGKRPYGVYLLMEDRTRAIVADFDQEDPFPPVEFLNKAEHYRLPAYIEASKSKGFHVWIFFPQEGVKAKKARLVVNHLLEEIEHPDIEVFPKQDFLDPRASFGNFINAPLFGGLVPRRRTVFVNPGSMDPFPDQWAFLDSVKRVSEGLLDDIISINSLGGSDTGNVTADPSPGNAKSSGFGLPPCVQKILVDGVSQYQRVTCFRLAVSLKRVGLPYDVAVAALKTWALKNTPGKGQEVIRDSEIVAQTSYAYERSYTGYGCDSPAISSFCRPTCRVSIWRQNTKIAELKGTEHE